MWDSTVKLKKRKKRFSGCCVFSLLVHTKVFGFVFSLNRFQIERKTFIDSVFIVVASDCLLTCVYHSYLLILLFSFEFRRDNYRLSMDLPSPNAVFALLQIFSLSRGTSFEHWKTLFIKCVGMCTSSVFLVGCDNEYRVFYLWSGLLSNVVDHVSSSPGANTNFTSISFNNIRLNDALSLTFQRNHQCSSSSVCP